MRCYLLLLLLWLPVVCLAGENLTQRDYAVLERAYSQLQQDKYQDCLKTLSPLLNKNYPTSHALSYAALASGGEELFDQAILFLKKGTQLYPEKKNFWHNLGNYQLQTDNFAGAVKTYQKLISMDKENMPPSYHYYLSFAWYQLERYDRALDAVSKITCLQPVKRHHLMLQFNCQIALAKWAACEKTIRRLIRLDPAGAANWELLGRVAVNRMDYDWATAAFEVKDIIAPPASTDPMLKRLYQIQSAWNEVARLHGNGIAMEHGAAKSYLCAKNLFLAGQYKKALTILDADDSLNMETSYLRGCLLFALGMNREAVDSLLKAQRHKHLFIEPGERKDKLGRKEKRRKKDALRAKALLLAGQIYWVDRNWLGARKVFKKLELLPGKETLGKSLAAYMQFYLDETRAEQILPGLYDPPLVIAQPDEI